DAIDLPLIEIEMKFVVHCHDRRPVAGAETDDRKQSEAAVGSSLAEVDTQARTQVIALPLVPHDPAAHAVAQHDDVPADRLTEDQVIEGRDAVLLSDGHFDQLGDVAEAVVGYPSTVSLHDAHGFDADSLFGRVAREFRF